jgi:hypothetical protein
MITGAPKDYWVAEARAAIATERIRRARRSQLLKTGLVFIATFLLVSVVAYLMISATYGAHDAQATGDSSTLSASGKDQP